MLDSNCSPAGITYPIPGNDDALRSIALYCGLIADAVLDGLQQEAIAAGTDLGAEVDLPAADEVPAAEAAAEAPAVEEGQATAS